MKYSFNNNKLTVKLVKSHASKGRKVEENSDANKIIKVTIRLIDDNKISLGDVVSALEVQGISLAFTMLLYYNNKKKMFSLCGPIEEADTYLIPIDELNGELQLKYRNIVQSKSKSKKQSERPKEEEKNKRTKERKIGEIVRKVSEWRKLYTGTMEYNGKKEKHSLDEAADIVGIAKKTLDDYLLQIRAGKKYGFDFNIHCESKVGVLRSFVKSKKDNEKSGDDKNSNL